MTVTHTLRDAKARLSELLDRAARGERVEIVRQGAKAGRFRLLAVETGGTLRQPGALCGAFQVPEGFDAPDAELEALFEGPGGEAGPGGDRDRAR